MRAFHVPRPTLSGLAAAGLACLIATTSCWRDATAPNNGRRVAQGFRFDARFPAADIIPGGARTIVDFTKVRVVLRNADGGVAVDRVVDFPSGATSVELSLTVPLSAGTTTAGESMALSLSYINAAGDTVFRGGPDTVVVTPTTGGTEPPPPVSIPIRYSGTGAAAAAVHLASDTLTVVAGDPFSFTATAEDETHTVIPGTPIAWRSLDPLASVSGAGAGIGTTVAGRGTARIVAQLLTGPADTAILTVLPKAAAIAIVSGDAQAGATQGTQAPQPVVARVTATDGLAMQGVPVTFAAQNGGSVGTPNAVTDANGLAQTTWTLGPSLSAQSLTATAAGLAGSPVTFTALGQLVFLVQPSTAAAGASISPAMVVRAEDALGRLKATFNGNVALALSANPGGATLSGTTTVAAVGGIATFAGLSLDRPAAGYTLVATTPTAGSVTSGLFNITSAAATTLAFTTPPGDASQGATIAPPIVVTARDALGNTATGFAGLVTVAIGTNPSGGSLSGTTSVAAVAGVATFSNLSINLTGSGYTLMAAAAGLTGATSPAFTIGTPAVINAWTNASGGSWSTTANWSLGRAPVSTDSVIIATAGTYAVSLDVNFTGSKITVGGAAGIQTLVVGARTLTVSGPLTVLAGAELTETGGIITGLGTLVNQGTTTLTSGSIGVAVANTNLIVARGTPTLIAAVSNAPGATLRVQGSSVGGTGSLTVTNGFTNAGAIEITSIDAGFSSALNVTSGPLVNAPGGTIAALAGTGGSRTLGAQMDNQGTLSLATGLTLNHAGVAHSNSGSIAVSGGNLTLTLSGTGAIFTNTGTITVGSGRSMSVTGGVLNLTSGLLDGSAATLSTSGTTLAFTTATARTRFSLASTTILDTVRVPAGDSLIVVGGSLDAPAVVNNGLLLMQGTSAIGAPLITGPGSTLRVRGSSAFGAGSATISNAFTNSAAIELTSIDAGFTATLTVNGTLVNGPAGSITSLGGAGGSRTLITELDNRGTVTLSTALTLARASAAHVNTGAINVTGGNLTLSQSGTTPSFTNGAAGTVTLAAGRTLTASGGALNLTSGLLTGTSAVLSTNGVTLAFSTATARTRFDLTATTIIDTVTIPVSDSLLIVGGSLDAPAVVNSGLLLMQGTSTVTGALITNLGSTLRVRGSSAFGGANATISTGFTNTAAIELTSIDAGFTATLTVNGTLVNGSAGSITSVGGAGGSRTLVTQLDNRGTLTLSTALTLARAGAAHINTGAINVTGGNLTLTQSGATPSFTNASGGTITLASGRTWSASGGALNLTAGLLDGTSAVLSTSGVTLAFTTATARTRFSLSTTTVIDTVTIPASDSLLIVGGSLDAPAVVNNGLLLLQGTSAVTAALITNTGSTLRVRGSSAFGGASATISTAFTNTAAIELTSIDAGFTATLTVNGTLVNGSPGSITALSGAGGGRTLVTQLDNRGTLTLATPLTLSRADAVHTNSGSINITGGNLTLTQSGTTPSFTNTGTIAVSSGRAVSVTGGALNLTAGLFDGTSASLATNGVTLAFTTVTARTRFSLTATTIVDTVTIPVGDSLLVVAGSLDAPAVVNNGVLLMQGTSAMTGDLVTLPGSTLRVRGSSAFGAAAVTIAKPFTNTAGVELTSIDAGFTTSLTVNGTLVNGLSGVIAALTGAGGSRTLVTELDNRGTVTLGTPLTLSRASAAHINSGAFNITGGNLTLTQTGTTPSFTNAPGGTITLASGRTLSATGGALNLTSGLLDGTSAMLATNGVTLAFTTATARTRFSLTATTIVDTVTIPASDSLLIVAGSLDAPAVVNNGVLLMQGTSAVGGNLVTMPGSLLRVRGSSAFGGAAATIVNAFTNSAGIELTSIDAGFTTTLTVNGTLVNGVTGTIAALPGAGGSRTFVTQLDNHGVVTVSTPMTLARASANHVNGGTIDVVGGNLTLTQSGTAPSFVNSGTITLASGRTLSVTGGALDLRPGFLTGPAATLSTSGTTLAFTTATAQTRLTLASTTIVDTVTIPAADSLLLVGGSLDAPAVVNNGLLLLQGSTSITGAMITSPGSTIRVRGGSAFNAATATFASGFVNSASIDLTTIDAGFNVTLNVNGTLVNAPSGTITSSAGAGGSRTIATQLDNRGLVTLGTATSLSGSDAAHVNSGTLAVAGGNLTVGQTGTSPSFTNTGSITLAASRTMTVTGGALDLTAGLLSGPSGTLATSGTALRFTVPAARTRFSFTSTTIADTVTVPAGDSLLVVAGSLAAPAVVNNGLLLMQGTSSIAAPLITGAGSTLRVRGSSAFGAAAVTVANGFTNTAAIDITSIDAGFNSVLTITAGTLVNGGGGTFTASLGSGGSRTLTAPLVNNVGSFLVDQSLSANTPVDQRGILTVSGSRTLTLSGLLQLFTGSTTTINGALVKNGGCASLGGSIGGAGAGATCP